VVSFQEHYEQLKQGISENPSILKDLNSSVVPSLKEYEGLTRSYGEKVMVAGFKFEEHKVLTADGYILTVWRIPGPLFNYSKVPRKPIVLQHGLLDDSYTFLALNINKSLPLHLANQGYDVWLPNVRGNIFSTEHIKAEIYDSYKFYSDYWNFTFHEMALYDLPAYLEYIINTTGFEKVDYVGHSQGTMIFYLNFIMDSTFLTKYVDKFVALGSVFTLNGATNASRFVRVLEYTWFADILESLYIRNIFNLGTDINRLLHAFCKNLLSVCKYVISSLVQTKPTGITQWNQMLGLFYYEPGGSSTKNMIHWIQNIRDKKVRQFDYGKKLNQQYYGQPDPPEYNLTKLKDFNFPSYLVAGDCDPFTQKEDFDLFLSYINLDGKTTKFLKNYNHLDYVWADEAYDDIYVDVFKFLHS